MSNLKDDEKLKIKKIHSRNIVGTCKLSLDVLDSRGNQYPGN